MVNRPCYTEYVRHAMRFYARYLTRNQWKNQVEKANWYACHNVFKTYSDKDKEILIYVYGAYDTISDNVYTIANKLQIDQNIIWDIMREFERKVAIERGLSI